MSDKQTDLDLEDDGSDGASADPVVGHGGDPEDDGSTPDPVSKAKAEEPKPEPEAEPAPAAAAAEGDEPADGKGTMIPRSRFNEVNEDRKALREQNQRLMDMLAQAQAAPAAAPAQAAAAEPAPQPVDLRALRKERLAALNAGDDDKALEMDELIDAENRRISREEDRLEREAEEARASVTQAKDVAANAKRDYPQLDEAGAEANSDAIDFVILKRDALIAQGEPAHKALQAAVDNAAKLFGWSKASAAAPAPAPAPTGARPNPAEDRAIAARTRGAQAAAVQPPPLGGTGNRTSGPARKDVAEMTETEFRSLSDAELDELGGNR